MSTKAEWELSFDGYYPYCTNCAYEPFLEVIKEKQKLQDIKVCPHCGSEMSYPYAKFVQTKS